MKKQYIKPESNVIIIAMNSILCTSLTVAGDTNSVDFPGADSRESDFD